MPCQKKVAKLLSSIANIHKCTLCTYAKHDVSTTSCDVRSETLDSDANIDSNLGKINNGTLTKSSFAILSILIALLKYNLGKQVVG